MNDKKSVGDWSLHNEEL